MWDWNWLCPASIENKKSLLCNPQNNLLPIQIPIENEDAQCSPSLLPLASFKMILASFLSRSNTNNNVNICVKYLALALFSPLLLPLVCAFFPFLCALELFFRLCRRRWRRKRRKRTAATVEGCGGDGAVGNEEMGNEQRLLQRYLEDQLILVVGSLYDQCVDDGEVEEEILGVDAEYFDSESPSQKLGKL